MSWIIKIKTSTGVHLRHGIGDPAELEQAIGAEFEGEHYGITTIRVLP